MTLLYPYWVGLHRTEAKRAAAWVFGEQGALNSYELGETRYPANVERELDRLITNRNKNEKG
ncbi:MAG: hypothetical protein JWR63_1076 [Conexibacter sp.]|nr:hypothetical protein [Conexibacter sp.]